MNPTTWREMVEAANELYLSLGDGVKRIEENEQQTAIVQRRALYYRKDLKAGHVIEKKDLFPVRPIKQDGISPYEIDRIVGKKISIDVKSDDYVKWSDFE